MKQQQNFSTKLGIIPQGWHIKRLGEICTHFQSGTSITSKQLKKNGQYPVYGGNGLRGYTDKYTHDGPYILIGRQGALCGNINFVENKNFISEHAIAVQSNENMIWLKYKLEYWNLNRFSESSAQPGLSVKKLARQKLTIPPLPEQQKIAEIISTWDKAIEKQSQLTEKLEMRKKGLTQQLLTAKRRLPGFSTPWKKVKLGEICNITTGKLDANAMEDNGIYPFFTCAKDVYKINKYAFDTEALLISGNGEYVGYVHYCKGKFNAYQRTYVLDRFRDNIFYLKYTLQYYLPKRILQTKSNSNTPYIVIGTLKYMIILEPSMAEQTAIAEVLKTADHEIELAKQKLELFRQQKHGLMQQLLTGKKRVKL